MEDRSYVVQYDSLMERHKTCSMAKVGLKVSVNRLMVVTPRKRLQMYAEAIVEDVC